MKKIICLSLFIFGCSGTTGYIPEEYVKQDASLYKGGHVDHPISLVDAGQTDDTLACTATVLYQEDMGQGCNEVMADDSIDVDCTIWCDDVKLLLTQYCPLRNEVGCGCAHTSIGHDVCVAWF